MMRQHSHSPNRQIETLLTVALTREPDIVTARQRARQIAQMLGFDQQDQVRFATATSEIGRNAIQYAGTGRVEFSLGLDSSPPRFLIQVMDDGPGIADVNAILLGRYKSLNGMGVGLAGTQRLMDHFVLDSKPGSGTSVEFGKALPQNRIAANAVESIRQLLARERAFESTEDVRQQNHDLLATLAILQEREQDLRKRQEEVDRLNEELEDTNRGVVALYAELEERAEALRSANEIKSRFLSHMSHEFRTPLNSILALSDLLARKADGDLTSGQEEQVGYIRRAASELFEMVNDLLDLAKVEAGKLEIKNSSVNVEQLFGALRGMLKPLSTCPDVALVIEEPSTGWNLYTDEGKLAQILRNLVSNALKFTQRGEVRLSCESNNGRASFVVKDSGIGIAPEHIDLIFQDFGQIDSSIQRRVKGTGLGLPLSRKLAELLGGTLTVESKPGVGSTFTLSVPNSQQDGASTESTAASQEDSEDPGSILLIDDEEVSRYLLKQSLKGTRHRIIEATNGVEGSERARFEKPHLIFLDLNMPGLDGFEVLEELKSDPETKEIPVVIHSSMVLRPEDLARLGGRQAAILSKTPPPQPQAIDTVRTLLGEPYLFQ